MSDNTSERAAFEAWAIANDHAYRNNQGIWFYHSSEQLWLGFQGGLATKAAPLGQGEPVALDARCRNTYETTSGDTIVCKSCGACWNRGAESACGRAVKQLQGAGYTSPPPSIPVGMRLVPVEPTPEMVLAFQEGSPGDGSFWGCWRAACLAAPPTQPAQAEKKGM